MSGWFYTFYLIEVLILPVAVCFLAIMRIHVNDHDHG